MTTIAYIGSAAEAAGFRLAGARAAAPAPDEVDVEFARALREARVVIVSTRCAAQIAPAQLEAALMGTRPWVVIAPDADEPAAALDPAERVRRQLGLDGA